MDINKLSVAFTNLIGWHRNGFAKNDLRLKSLESNRKITSAVANQAEFDQTVNSAPSQEEIFNTWYRFSHGNTQTFPFLPAETLDWALNPDGSIRNTFNSVSWIGVVGPNKYTEFVLDVDIWSTNADDDTIGLAVCFDKDPVTGAESIITVGRSTGGTALYEIWYNPGQAAAGGTYRIYNGAAFVKWGNGQPGTMTKVEAGQGNNDPGWATVAARRGGIANGKVRLRIERKGDIITFQTSDWDNPDLLIPETLFTLDLKSNPKLEKFRAGARYGFVASSQQDSYWKVREFSNPNDAIYRLDTGKVYKNIDGSWVEATDMSLANLGENVWLFNPATKKSFYRQNSEKTWCFGEEPIDPNFVEVPVGVYPSVVSFAMEGITDLPGYQRVDLYAYGWNIQDQLTLNAAGRFVLPYFGSISKTAVKHGELATAFVERVITTDSSGGAATENTNLVIAFAVNTPNPPLQMVVKVYDYEVTLDRQMLGFADDTFVVGVNPDGTSNKEVRSGDVFRYTLTLINNGGAVGNGLAIINKLTTLGVLQLTFK